MDAAKLNRCLQVTQGAASETDLLALAEGCLLASRFVEAADDAEPIVPPSRERLRGLCRAFQDIQADKQYWEPHPPRTNGSAGLFHQRDFVYLLRNLRRSINRSFEDGAARLLNEDVPFSAEVLLTALRRNFGGVSEESFARLSARFLRGCGFNDLAARPHLLTLDSISTLRDSLTDSVEQSADPNTAAFRHVLLLDPTDVEVAVGMVRCASLVCVCRLFSLTFLRCVSPRFSSSDSSRTEHQRALLRCPTLSLTCRT
jgi:hypothetical protein